MLNPKNTPQQYYYGEGTDNVVMLTEAEADAVNKLRYFHVKDDLYLVNLNAEEMESYESAAKKLNEYLALGTSHVYGSEEFVAEYGIVRPVN